MTAQDSEIQAGARQTGLCNQPEPGLSKQESEAASQACQEIDNKPQTARQIVLAGNPNVGKSVIFNALTGANADVSNYPGTTIDIARGKLGNDLLSDTPGVYGLSSFNDEERTATSMILKAEIVINVISALTLERDLFLTLQLIDLGKPMLLVINQTDEAKNRGMQLDINKLGEELGLKVISCVAVENLGIDEIKNSLSLAAIGKCIDGAAEQLKTLMPFVDEGTISRGEALLLAEGDEDIIGAVKARAPQIFAIDVASGSAKTAIYSQRRKKVNELAEKVVARNKHGQNLSTKLGRLLLHPLWGSITSIAVCYLIFYQMLGVWIAGNLVDLTEKKGMKVYYEPVVRRVAASYFPCSIEAQGKTWVFDKGTKEEPAKQAELDQAIRQVPGNEIAFDFWHHHNWLAAIGNTIVGDYGLATLTVTYLLGLLMPLVIGFYLGLSLMEDSGYLPRLAVLVDRLMNKIGLNGRAIIPLILGLGCVTMATITTRLLTSRREKIIATALLGVAIPCSAQLGVVSGTLARAGGAAAWAVYLTLVFGILALTGLMLNAILPGRSSGLLIDLPPMRLPRLNNVLKKTWKKSWNFLLDAIPMFFLAGFVVSLAEMSGLLQLFMNLLSPLVVSWLNLPADPRIPTTFILGIVRRDFASFGISDIPLTAVQAVTAMIVITLFVPCIATVGVMIKERGPKIAFTIWIGSWLAAFAIGGIVARVLPFFFNPLGIT